MSGSQYRWRFCEGPGVSSAENFCNCICIILQSSAFRPENSSKFCPWVLKHFNNGSAVLTRSLSKWLLATPPGYPRDVPEVGLLRILQRREFTWLRAGPRGVRTYVPQWDQGQRPGRRSGDEVLQKLKQNVKLLYIFNVILDIMNIRAELGEYV